MTEDDRAVVLAHVADHIALTRAEPGCLSFDIAETDDPMTFEVMESFRDRAAFDAHQARTRDSAWFAATRHILRDFRIEEVGD
ncbi:putative quinol monooxygenase [Gemmobacter caeruleus]|uniref:putative quinol monooxygenase n=1 Tax=Gemmobacter caeruleus TaxID=2595004 RepID=UPI001EF11447|nr:antibiotic biosynthesis monooxygenase [Gemmobacter caeruleus]